MKALIAACTRRPIATLMSWLGIVILGAIAIPGLRTELLPEVRVPRLVVSAGYPGMPAGEVRVLLTIALEDSLASLRGVRHIASVSRDGAATISLEYQWGTDMQTAAVEARERIDAVAPQLPSQAARPVVLPVDPAEEPVLLVGVFPRSGDLALARRLAEREIRTRLQQVSGAGSIALVGGAREEVRVLVDQDKAAARGVRLAEIADALAAWNVELPAGSIIEGASELLVRTEAAAIDPLSLAALPVLGQGRPAFALREVARVVRGARDQESVFQVDGREGIGLQVRKRPGASPVALSRALRAELAELSRAYGRDLELRVVRDTSRFVSRSLSDLVVSAAAGAAIAFVVLLLFLRHLPTCLILISSVPVSMVASLLLLRVAGRGLNVMSVGGLSMGIGMMMDNSVVILETLLRRLGGGAAAAVTPQAVAGAADELSGSNTGSTVTSIVVFLPVIFLPGAVGALFTDLALAVIFSQVVSLAVSVTLVPVLFLLTRGAGRVGRAAPKMPRGPARLEALIRRALRAVLRRPLILGGVLAATTAAGIAGLRVLPFEFLPPVDTGEILVTARLPAASSVAAAASAGKDVAARLLAVRGVASVDARAGCESDDVFSLADPARSPDVLHATATLTGGRRGTASFIAEECRKALEGAACELSVDLPPGLAAPLLGLAGGRAEIRVTGAGQDQAREVAGQILRELEGSGAAAAATLSPQGEKPELHLVPDRAAMARAGVDAASLALAARAALDGIVAARLPAEGRELEVRVLADTAAAGGDGAGQAGGLGGIRVRGRSGEDFRLSGLAAIVEARAPAALARADRKDTVSVLFSPPASTRGSDRRLARAGLEAVLQNHPEAELLETSAIGQAMVPLGLALVLVVVLLYLVLGVQFESFLLPVYLLASLPLSFSGIFAGLALAGKSINADSLLGIIVLFGIAVNNTIVLYETYAHRVRAAGQRGIPAAVYGGTAQRLRPILITMLSTVAALVPIALDPTGTSTQSSMAVAIIGGLFVSTALTVFAAPLIYLRHFARQARGR